MIYASISGDEQVKNYFLGRETAINSEVSKTVLSLTLKLQRKIIEDKLNGQVLNNRTGRLWRSVTPQMMGKFSGRVFSNVEYAAIHEYGGRTPAHEILPKRKKALYFNGRFAKRVNHPGSVMPERSFMRTALAEMQPEIASELNQALGRALR